MNDRGRSAPETLERRLTSGVERRADDCPRVASFACGFHGRTKLSVGVGETLAGRDDPSERLAVLGGVSVGTDRVQCVHFAVDGLRHGRSPQKVVAARLESVGVDDPGWSVSGHRDEFEHVTGPVGTDHKKPLVSPVVVLNEADGVLPRVNDVLGGDSVAVGAPADLHAVKSTFTVALCQGDVYASLVPVADGLSDTALAAEQGPGTNDSVVAESPALKEKLKTINFGRVPGGNR